MILLIALWAVLVNWFAYKKGFYRLKDHSPKDAIEIRGKDLLVSFGTYLLLSLIALPIAARFILLFFYRLTGITSLPIEILTGLQFITMTLIFLVLLIYFKRVNPLALKRMWKDRERKAHTSIEFDVGIGIAAWFLSFPIVSVFSHIIDQLVRKLFVYKTMEQAAVKFLKAALAEPISLFFAIMSVLVLAPLAEELLFRGVLQNYFKKRMGFKPALLISSLTFALFHFSFSQSLGNISLIFSLFILGGFLGFIYERQGSLWTSIALHFTYNAVSAIRIIYLPEALS